VYLHSLQQTEQHEYIVHAAKDSDGDLILSVDLPIGMCNRTGGLVYHTDVEGYSGYSMELHEDLYNFEFEKF